MDEEDLREAEESRHLSTTNQFSGFGTEYDPNRQSVLMDIFRPSGETIGVKLLKRMGWKEGQGIGPRVKRKVRMDEEGNESDETHFFPPDDPPMISFSRKNDFKGVGYEGGLSQAFGPTLATNNATSGRQNIDVTANPSTLADKSQKTSRLARRTGFGVGILNDTGSDDEDPYEMGPKISYNRVIGGDKKEKRKQGSSTTSADPLLKEKPVFMSKKSLVGKHLSGFRKCHDSRLPLEGFVLSNELETFSSMSLDEDMKPLEVPSDWVSSKSSSATRTESSYLSTRDAAKASSLDAQTRATILGENPLPSKSVFDFLSPAARERLVQATGKSNLPAAGNEVLSATKDSGSTADNALPRVDQSAALQALNRAKTGWTPYADDPSKRSRYEAFLELCAHNQTSHALPNRPTQMTNSDFIQELHEFARVTEVFKPVSGLMASRFTTASQDPGLAQSGSDGNNVSNDGLLTRPERTPLDPAVEAARMGMFGVGLTRFVESWQPPRLLCKRFNVPVPENTVPPASGGGESKMGGSSFTTAIPDTALGRFQSAGFQRSEAMEVESRPQQHSKAESSVGPGVGREMRVDAALIPAAQPLPQTEIASAPTVAPVDPGLNEALERERPGQAVFKAIFGSDDEDEE